MTALSTTAATVARIVTANRFHYRCEQQLQEGLAAALTAAGLPVRREVPLSGTDRVDLLVEHVGIEVKVAGAAAQVGGQLQRYARSDQLAELVLVTTRARHRVLPARVAGKPLTVLFLGGIR